MTRKTSSVVILLACAVGMLLAPRPARAVVDTPESLHVHTGELYPLGGTHSYTHAVQVDVGGVLSVRGYTGAPNTGFLEIAAPTITVFGIIDGIGRGYRSDEGPGTSATGGGGGAGFGGAGGNSGHSGSGGPAYGTAGGTDFSMGSGGASGSGGGQTWPGGAGGALIILKAGTVAVHGSVIADGAPGATFDWAPGGGSGGCICVRARLVWGFGIYSAQGGAGGNASGNWGGGGGGGGRIKIGCCDLVGPGALMVNGGGGGAGSWPGAAGATGSIQASSPAEPAIIGVKDVRNDQGRQVRLAWTGACMDYPQAQPPVTHYTIWRRIDPLPGAREVAPQGAGRGLGTQAYPPGVWDYVATVPARGEDTYSTVVPTLADSNHAGIRYSAFFVSAVQDDPFACVDTPADSGYSVDNLPPETPDPFKGTYLGSSTALHWGACAAPDFSAYELYRGDAAGFVPGPANLVVSRSDTGYVDAVSGGHFYKLCSVDVNGNRGGYAPLTPAQAGATPEGFPAALWLGHPTPNPARGGAAVRFALPRKSAVTLAVFDAQGRRVTDLVEGTLPAGEHSAIWNGRTAAGGVAASGVYFLRLVADGTVVTRAVAVVR